LTQFLKLLIELSPAALSQSISGPALGMFKVFGRTGPQNLGMFKVFGRTGPQNLGGPQFNLHNLNDFGVYGASCQQIPDSTSAWIGFHFASWDTLQC